MFQKNILIAMIFVVADLHVVSSERMAFAQSFPVISATNSVADETQGYIDFAVRLSAPSAQNVSVNYFNNNASASYSDFGAISSSLLTFAPGETSKSIRVTVTDDTLLEGAESFYLGFFGSVNAVVGTGSVTGTIVDNDAPIYNPTVTISDPVVDESRTRCAFVIKLSHRSNFPVSISYTLRQSSAGTADYTRRTASLAFAPGELAKTVSIAIANDLIREDVEIFNLEITNVIGANLPDNRGTARIWKSDQASVGTPTISVDNAVAGEGDGFLEFIVRLSAPSTQNVSVNYFNNNASASYSDFGGLSSGSLAFAPGETLKTVRVTLTDDTSIEGNESFYFGLFGATNAVVGTGTATGTIVDNDNVSGLPTVFVNDVVVDEIAGNAVFNLRLNRRVTDNASLRFSTEAGSASVDDFGARGGIVVFAAGESSKYVEVPIRDDTAVENTESFDLMLSLPSGLLLPDNRGTARIWKSDQASVGTPTISVDNAVAGEGDGFLEFIVRLSAPSTQNVSVNYFNNNASASYSDFGGLSSGSLAFAPGETLKTVRVTLTDDTSIEGNESFYFGLFGATNAVVGTETATGTIVDND